MKTKTLLIAAAALAAGVISSEAQVYSQNIVGYVNVPVKLGFNTVANPLDNSINNSLTNIITPGPAYDGSTVSLWTGTTYSSVTIDSTVATGVADSGDNFAVTPPVLNPGQAFFFNNTVASNTVTAVGNVHVGGPGPGFIGLATNTLPSSPSQSFVSSVIPVGGGLASVLQLTNAANPAAYDGCVISIPQINNAGNVTGFNVTVFDSTFNTGFGDSGDNFAVPEPVISVSKGFFFNDTTGSPIKWIQSF
jgi:hypothetical protein